jgi:hypothetical protein
MWNRKLQRQGCKNLQLYELPSAFILILHNLLYFGKTL